MPACCCCWCHILPSLRRRDINTEHGWQPCDLLALHALHNSKRNRNLTICERLAAAAPASVRATAPPSAAPMSNSKQWQGLQLQFQFEALFVYINNAPAKTPAICRDYRCQVFSLSYFRRTLPELPAQKNNEAHTTTPTNPPPIPPSHLDKIYTQCLANKFKVPFKFGMFSADFNRIFITKLHSQIALGV